jgi:hypothetical protein
MRLKVVVWGLIAWSTLNAQPRCAPPPPDLSAWFTFDEDLFRQAGEHRPDRVRGLVGTALRFNGKDQYFEIPAATAGLDAGEEDFTIELWIRTKDSVHTRNLVDKRDNHPVGYLIFLYKGHPGFQVDDGRVDGVVARSQNIADSRWRHVAGVAKRLPLGSPEIYVDGEKQPDKGDHWTPLANLDVPSPLWLGRHHANRAVDRENIFFEGEMDELSFYHRALTAAEIQSIFRAGSHGKCRPRH